MRAALLVLMVVLALSVFLLLYSQPSIKGVGFLDALRAGSGVSVNISYVYLHFSSVPGGVPVVGGKVLVSYVVVLGVSNPTGGEVRVERLVASIPYSLSLQCGAYRAYFTLEKPVKYTGVIVELSGENATLCSYSMVDDLLHGFNHYTEPVTVPPHSSVYLMITGVVEAPASWKSLIPRLRSKPVYILASLTAETAMGKKQYAVVLEAEKLSPVGTHTYYFSRIPGGVTAKLDNSEVVTAWIIAGRR